MNDTSTYQQQEARDETRPQRTPAEWTTFIIATLLLLAVVGLLLYDWLATPQSPPNLQVTQGEVWQTNDQFYVPFTLQNTGGDTAETVQVIAELSIDGQVIEDGEQQFDFLAGNETQEGAFIFTQDPAEGELSLRVASYKLPH